MHRLASVVPIKEKMTEKKCKNQKKVVDYFFLPVKKIGIREKMAFTEKKWYTEFFEKSSE